MVAGPGNLDGLRNIAIPKIQNRQRLIQRMYSCWLCTAMPKDPAGLISSEMIGLGRGSDMLEWDRNGICFLKYGAEAAETEGK